MQAPENLKNMGFSTRKAHNIVDLARQLEEGKMLLTEFNNLNDEMLINRLQEIPGVGRWTAEYVALRGMGRLDVFPADDLGGQVKIQQWLGLKERPSADQVRQVLKQWSPFRGLLYYYLMQHDHAGPAAKPQSPSLAPRS